MILFGFVPIIVYGQISHIVTFDFDKLKIESKLGGDGNTYTELEYENCYINDSIGYPSLPYRYLRFIVPNEPLSFSISINESTNETVGLSTPLLPIQSPVPTSVSQSSIQFNSSNLSVYTSMEIYPKNSVEIVNEGYLDGNKRILTVRVAPVQYRSSTNQLYFHPVMKFTISYNNQFVRNNRMGISSISSVNGIKNDELTKLLDFVENKSDINSFVNSPQLRMTAIGMNLPSYEYVVVTSESLAPYFKRLIDWKRQKGLNAGIVTIQDILNDASITKDEVSNLSDDAGRLRQYLRLAYQNGTKYVLLGGNDTVVPIRYGSGYNNKWNLDDEIDGAKIPSDLYFSDLNGNWNVDGDEYLGEPNEDNIDYYPEIYVGRVLCKNGTEVENYVYKLLKYEQNPGNGDFGYLKKAFYTQADQMQDLKQANFIATSLSGIFPSYVIFQEKEGYNTPELPTFPTGKDVIDEMNNKYGLCSWFGHGGPTFIIVASRIINGGTYYMLNPTSNCWQTANEIGNTFMELANINYPSIAYTIACTTTSFDKFPSRNSIDYQYNMGEAFTIGGKMGGVAYLGNTRSGWVTSSKDLFDRFVDRIKNGDYNLGVSEAKSKSLNTSSKHWLAFAHNLIGCPELEMWTDIPSKFTNVSVSQSGMNLNVNSMVDGSSTTLKGLFSSNKITSQIGKVCTFMNIPKNYMITFNKHNYLPYVASMYLQNEEVRGVYYVAGNEVFIGSHIDGNKSFGDFVVKSGSKLTFGIEEITLDSGTLIELGAEFEVELK